MATQVTMHILLIVFTQQASTTSRHPTTVTTTTIALVVRTRMASLLAATITDADGMTTIEVSLGVSLERREQAEREMSWNVVNVATGMVLQAVVKLTAV
jgi:hypothetical protein